MQLYSTDWDKWAQYLQQKKMIGLARFLLDAVGPFRIIAAQSLLLTKPFISNPIIDNFAKILEDDQASKEFNKFLQLKGTHE